MHAPFLAIALSVLAAGPTAASDKKDAMAAVQQFVDGFNKGDGKAAAAVCADQTSIIDEFAPYEWHGAGACAKWMSDFDADAKKNEITDGNVTLGKPRHVDVAGNHAYIVVPANYAYKQKGQPAHEIGSLITLSLEKGDAGWRITGWAWGKH